MIRVGKLDQLDSKHPYQVKTKNIEYSIPETEEIIAYLQRRKNALDCGQRSPASDSGTIKEIYKNLGKETCFQISIMIGRNV